MEGVIVVAIQVVGQRYSDGILITRQCRAPVEHPLFTGSADGLVRCGAGIVARGGINRDVRALCSRRVDVRLLQVAVLVPCKTDHEDVHCRDEKQPHGVGSVEPVQLVHDEQPKDSNRDRVVPKARSQQANDQPELDDAMAQEVEGCEVARADREMLGRLKEVVGDEVTRVFQQLLSCDALHELEDVLLRNKVHTDPSQDLTDREGGFQDQTHSECKVDALFFEKAALHFPGDFQSTMIGG